MLPLDPVVALLINLTYTAVEVNVPDIGVNDRVELYVPEIAFEISKPVGAVKTTLAFKLEPETVNICGVITQPEHEVKVFKLETVKLGAVSVKL